MPRLSSFMAADSSDGEADPFLSRDHDNEAVVEELELLQWPLRQRCPRPKVQRNAERYSRRFWSSCDCRRRIRRSAVCISAFVLGALLMLILVTVMDWPPDDPFDNALRELDGTNRVLKHISNDAFMEVMDDVSPMSCHSHNDYWRIRPLYAALATGCTSVEADVWLLNDELSVGHSIDELRKNVTLEHLYIAPLQELLAISNARSTGKINDGSLSEHEKVLAADATGLFRQDPRQTLVLLIDFKTPAITSLASVSAALQPLRRRGWLTHWNGRDRIDRPVTVVATGDVPFELIVANTTYRDIFFDAPLDGLPHRDDRFAINADGSWTHTRSKYNTSNSYYASTSLQKAIGPLRHRAVSSTQRDALKSQIAHAKRRGLVPRYWGTPRWPRWLRNRIWNMLVHIDVGVLNVDDLRAFKDGNWRA